MFHFLELIRHYGPSHTDYNNCLEARVKLLKVTKRLPSALRRSVIYYNFFIHLLCIYLVTSYFINYFFGFLCRRISYSSASWKEIWSVSILFMLQAESLYDRGVLPSFHKEKVTNSACFFWQVEACFNIILFVYF